MVTTPSQTQLLPDADLCGFRDDAEIAKQQKKFVEHFIGAPGPVVDLGCGRGIMLELLRSAGIDAYGVDTFAPAVEVCRSKNLRVDDYDVLAHLRRLPPGSLGGIFCSHLVEHFHPPEALALLKESARVLRPDGQLVIITPNSKDLGVLTEGFWLDLTHVRFYPPRLLIMLLRQAGFISAYSYEDGDTAYSSVFHRKVAGWLRRLWLWGYTNRGDVVVVSRK